MIGRILKSLLRGRRVHVPDTTALADGTARTLTLGDLAAGGTQVLLCRVGGTLHALDTRCPHEGGRLQPGALVQGRYAKCPLHNYLFDPTNGAVVSGNCRKATVYRVRERDGGAEIAL